MEEIGRNIAMYGTRVTAHRISFALSKEEQDEMTKYDFEKEKQVEEYAQEFAIVDEKTGKRLDLSGMVMMDTSRTKNIVSTQINGQSATIKEWINNGDYAITLTIAVTSEREEYPEQRLKEIINICDINRTLKVENKYLNEILKITRIVITGHKTTPEVWKTNQTIVLDCMSDEGYIIEEELLK